MSDAGSGGARAPGAREARSNAVCAQMTAEFLTFSRSAGNAYRAGCAPPVFLAATNEAALRIVPREALMSRALDVS